MDCLTTEKFCGLIGGFNIYNFCLWPTFLGNFKQFRTDDYKGSLKTLFIEKLQTFNKTFSSMERAARISWFACSRSRTSLGLNSLAVSVR